jgi:hypothetical protein
MKDLLTLLPDGTAEVRSFAVDEKRYNVAVFGMDFDGDKIRHMMRQLGWAS